MPRAKDRVRICQQCNSEFQLGVKMGQYKYCSVPCRKAWHAAKFKTSERVKKDPRRAKDYWLKTKYGISIEQFEEMHLKQNSKCGVCETPIGWSAHVDHEHKSGKVRDLLCSSCNQALGMLKEDPVIMEKMIEYLKRHSN